MANDLGKAALIAGIAIAISVLVGATGDAMVGLASYSMMFWLIALLLISVPLPAFLFILYRTRVAPVLSEGLRRTALVLTLILVARLAVFGMSVWRSVHLPASGPFFTAPVRSAIFDVAEFTERAAIIFFLLALSRQDGRLKESRLDARLVRKSALIAAVAGVVMLIPSFAFTLLFHLPEQAGGPGVWLTLRRVVFEIPAIAAPLIVYAGLRDQTVAATGLD